ncbi:MAG: hypothetical protein CMK44_06135 [Porticoccus sp.]|jgi:LAS superfamily LD-carboxypeptidase LdcB|nr:hypothetical protein [Porticoccus sp.]
MQITKDILSGKTQLHLANYDDKFLMHAEVLKPFCMLKYAAEKQGFDLRIASSFRLYERQLTIWNEKASGKREVLDSLGQPLDSNKLSKIQKVFAILRWSALPGCSRHHWGTDIDVWDAAAVPESYQPRLMPAEYNSGGPFYELSKWLRNESINFDFSVPYSVDNGGVAIEPWHISYTPLAKRFENALNISYINTIINTDKLIFSDIVSTNLDEIFIRFIKNKKMKSLI